MAAFMVPSPRPRQKVDGNMEEVLRQAREKQGHKRERERERDNRERDERRFAREEGEHSERYENQILEGNGTPPVSGRKRSSKVKPDRAGRGGHRNEKGGVRRSLLPALEEARKPRRPPQVEPKHRIERFGM